MTREQLARILSELALAYAPNILPVNIPADRLDLSKLAYDLAQNDVLVLKALIPEKNNYKEAVATWVNKYADFYLLFTRELFPSCTNIEARYASSIGNEAVVVIRTQLSDLSGIMAGIVVPFVANRQATGLMPTEYDLRIIIDEVLEAIAATDLQQDVYYHLIHNGKRLLLELIDLSVRHDSLTKMIRPVVEIIEKPPIAPPSSDTGGIHIPKPPPPSRSMPQSKPPKAPPKTTPPSTSRKNERISNGKQDAPKELPLLPDDDNEPTGSTTQIISRLIPRKRDENTRNVPPIRKKPKKP